jgi:NADH-quinone oxidoreductase subunit E
MSDFKVDHKQHSKEGHSVAFSEATLSRINDIFKRYPPDKRKSALLPVLHIAQEELGGYLSVDVMDYVAKLLNIQPVEVYEVATFYTQFYLEKTGKYVIEICHTAPCAINGGEKLAEYLRKKLNTGDGNISEDGLFTIREVECLGACGNGPVMQVNTEFFENLDEDKIDRIISDLRAKADSAKPEEALWVNKFF